MDLQNRKETGGGITMDVREKLVELIRKAKAAMKKENPACDIEREYFIAESLISNGVTVQEWISVKDRLPNPDEAVLVLAEYLYIKTNYYEVWSLFKCQSGEIIWVDKSGEGHNLTEVTHWMPLPEPPKGE
jgi:hypothetical protein